MHIVLNFRYAGINKKNVSKLCPKPWGEGLKNVSSVGPHKERKKQRLEEIKQGGSGLMLNLSRTVDNAYVHLSKNIVIPSISVDILFVEPDWKTFV
jgi:hypothetical protein